MPRSELVSIAQDPLVSLWVGAISRPNNSGMVFIAGKTVWSMPECVRVVCIPYKALYKWSDFILFYLFYWKLRIE